MKMTKNLQFNKLFCNSFPNFTIWKTMKMTQNLEFNKLSYVLSVQMIQTSKVKKKNLIFRCFNIRNFEISVVLHLVVTNVDLRSYN